MGIGVAVVLVGFLIKRLMHLDTLQRRRGSGRARTSSASPQAAGMHPAPEARPLMRAGLAAAAAAALCSSAAPTRRTAASRRAPAASAPPRDRRRPIPIPRPTAPIRACRRRSPARPSMTARAGGSRTARSSWSTAASRRSAGRTRRSPKARPGSTARGRWVTPGVIDVHCHLGDYPSPGVEAHQDGNEVTAPGPARSLGRAQRLAAGSGLQPRARQWRHHHAPGPARLGQPVRRPRRDLAQRAGADRAGDALPGRAARAQDGLRRESQARLRRPQPDAADADGQCRADARRPGSARSNIASGARATATPPATSRSTRWSRRWRATSSSTTIATAPTRWRSCSTWRASSASASPASTTRSRPTRSPTCCARAAPARRCGPTGGASRWKPMTRSTRISRSSTMPAPARSSIPTTPTASSGSTRKRPRRSPTAGGWGSTSPTRSPGAGWRSTRRNALGIADETGSLRAGKRADVVLWNGNPFSVYTRPEQVWIDGALLYDMNDPRRRPVSDFELGQPGEGDVK